MTRLLLILSLAALACGQIAPMSTLATVENIPPSATESVSKPIPAPEMAKTVYPTYAFVVAETLNLRSGPGTSFPVIFVLKYGASPRVTGSAELGDSDECDSWLPVSWFGHAGYVCARWLEIGG